MSGSISVALQGLSAAMRGFETTSNNISNVNTPGYSRQEIILSSRAAPEQGVQVVDVSRVVDTFATQQHWSSSSAFKSTEAYAFFAGQVDDLLANPATSISAATDDFFSALQTGVDDPSSIPNRELILAQSEALARRFSEVDRQLRSQNETINAKLQSAVSNVNELAGQVAGLNDLIRLADARGESANELKDQRDQLIMQVSEQVGATIQTGTGNSDINLYVGNGQPLVIGGNASTLVARQGDPDINDMEVYISINNSEVSVSEQIREGEVGGMLQFKDDVLLPTWNELGRLAIVFADTINQQHSNGLDLDGNLAGNLFTDPAYVGDVRAFSTNSTEISGGSNVIIEDTSLLQASDYVVKFGADGAFFVTRSSDGTVFTKDDFAVRNAALSGYQDATAEYDVANGEIRLNIDGLDIRLSSQQGNAFGENDKVQIQPVRAGAELIHMELKSGRELAFASPVRAEAAEDNGGTIAIGDIRINDRSQRIDVNIVPPAVVYFTDANTYSIYQAPAAGVAFDPTTATAYDFGDDANGNTIVSIGRSYDTDVGIDIAGTTAALNLIPGLITDPNEDSVLDLKDRPMQLVFGTDGSGNDTYSVFDMTDPSNPLAVSVNNPYSEGAPIQLQGFEFVPEGKPQPGDKLNFGYNTDAVSDNRNALKLSNRQQERLVDGGSYQDNYGRLVERIGTKASVANINMEANLTIMVSAESIRNGVSGVNLDEEAANLIKFQQQYQAASQVINTARELFQTLLNSTGG
ncbi:MAG: flagellar hook-associated protein FlgK [Motiliproteus sp.]